MTCDGIGFHMGGKILWSTSSVPSCMTGSFQVAFSKQSEKIYEPAKPLSHKIHLGEASHFTV